MSFEIDSALFLLRVSTFFMVLRVRLHPGSYVSLGCLSMRGVILLVNDCISKEFVCMRGFRVVFGIVLLVGLKTVLTAGVFFNFDTLLIFGISAYLLYVLVFVSTRFYDIMLPLFMVCDDLCFVFYYLLFSMYL